MTEGTRGITENTVKEVRPEVTAFKEAVAKADGTLLPLHKTTTDGKKLYIAARLLENPTSGNNEDVVNARFYGWGENHIPPMTGVLLVDTYMEEDGKIVPMGHEDWWLSDDYANGGGNMHDAASPKSEPEKSANDRWHKQDYTAFKVRLDSRGQGIGSLILATSAVVLPAIGIKKFYTGVLLDPGKKTYERFDIREDDFPRPKKPFDRHLPIERLSQHPQVDKTIAEFV